MNVFLMLGGLNGAFAVAAAAAGAHALKARAGAEQLDWFIQGAHFQLWHALALLAIGILHAGGHGSALSSAAGGTMQAGILLFSGSLYWLGTNGPGSLGALLWLTPLGGLLLIAGWGLLAAAGLFSRQ